MDMFEQMEEYIMKKPDWISTLITVGLAMTGGGIIILWIITVFQVPISK